MSAVISHKKDPSGSILESACEKSFSQRPANSYRSVHVWITELASGVKEVVTTRANVVPPGNDIGVPSWFTGLNWKCDCCPLKILIVKLAMP